MKNSQLNRSNESGVCEIKHSDPMSQQIKYLNPQAVWEQFAAINQIPRASKKEEQIVKFIMDFAEALQLDTYRDKTGNVIIRKPATKGLENHKTTILQAHVDMVHQKNQDTVFDFENQGIQMFVDENWVRAEGTTLGADNGIGVAAIMAILASDTIAHPPIEALLTVDEETGMTGATGLDTGVLQGEILLNLDTEDDEEICIGSAGGIDITATKEYKQTAIPQHYIGYEIAVKGLQGGHSGMDINRGLGNANKIMNRVLYHINAATNMRLVELQGGSLRNAIPRESTAIVAVDPSASLSNLLEEIASLIKAEFKTTEPHLQLSASKLSSLPAEGMAEEDQQALINAVYAAPNGVYAMSPDFERLVLSSNNIAKVSVGSGHINIQCLTRSSSESSKSDLTNTIRAAFELAGCTITLSGEYPGWQPDPHSEILAVLAHIYKKQNNQEPNIMAVHAGLECGILGEKYPHLDKISFGPTILGAHSPDERASIASVQKFWSFLLEILKNIPEKT